MVSELTPSFWEQPLGHRHQHYHQYSHHMNSLPHKLQSYAHTQWAPVQAPLTPPASAVDHHASVNVYTDRHTTVLPPISTFDRHPHAPPTPPYEASTQLPPLRSALSQDTGLSCDYADYVTSRPPPPPSVAPNGIDWLGASQIGSSRFLAEKTCEMICYLWFSVGAQEGVSSLPQDQPATQLQLVPNHVFVAFMQKVLETTQVSESVIVLALHYIYRLKREKFKDVNGLPGSEYRVAISALMLANKFVDDNTYTNKTWSEVANISLHDANAMEREFLEGLKHNLYVNGEEYDVWLKLLKGLVLTKERAREMLYHQRTRRAPRTAASSRPPPYHVTSHMDMSTRSSRARSNSPRRQTSPRHYYQLPSLHIPTRPSAGDPSPTRTLPMAIDAVAANAGAKRSATDAFSPTSVTFDQSRPQKRPTSMSLHIPQYPMSQFTPPTSHATSPMELTAFGRLNLGASDSPMQVTNGGDGPRALVASYRMDPSRQPALPQNLYYYALSGSPTETPSEDPEAESYDHYSRKGRLRYHQPTAASGPVYQPPVHTTYAPQVVQSATTSPRDTSRILPPLARPTLPSFSSGYTPAPSYATPMTAVPLVAPVPVPVYTQYDVRLGVPAAPFANAGPPGFHFHAGGPSIATPVHSVTPNWAWQHRGSQR